MWIPDADGVAAEVAAAVVIFVDEAAVAVATDESADAAGAGAVPACAGGPIPGHPDD